MVICIRRMTEPDIPFAMELKSIAGWNQMERDWLNYLRFEPEGCFIAEVAGEPVGTISTINYSDQVAWIGMLLVHPSSRREGIGTRLLQHAIDYLQSKGVAAIKLDATPMGARLYAPRGFQEEYVVYRMQGSGKKVNRTAFLPINAKTLSQVADYDRRAFGVGRGGVLARMIEDSPALHAVARDERQAVTGYLLARSGYEAYQIGPWIADTQSVAENLFEWILDRLQGERLFFDVPAANTAALALAQKHGFDTQREFIRMYLGDNLFPGSVQRIYGTSGAEKG